MSPSRTSPPRARTSSRTMASPSPLPPASRSRASSSRVNRSKTRSRSASADARLRRRATATTHRVGRRGRAVDLDRRTRVPDGVVDQVGQDPPQVLGPASARHVGRPPHGADRDPRAVVRGRRRPSTSGAHGDRVRGPTCRGVVGVEPGQHQQVLDQSRPSGAPPRAGPPVTGVPSPSRSATSSWVRIEASGLRSSWAASATNDRCRARAAASRSSMEFRVTASAWISSPEVGHRAAGRPGRCPEIRSAVDAQHLHRAQGRARSPARRSGPARRAAAGRSTSSVTLQDVLAVLRCRRTAGRPRPCGGRRPVRRARRRRAAASRAPTREPGTTTPGPAEGRGDLAGQQQRGQPVGVHRGADHPVPGVDDLHDLAAGDRDGVGQPVPARPGPRPRRRWRAPASSRVR